MRKRRTIWLIVLTAIFLPVCLCGTYGIGLLFGSDIAGYVIATHIKYPSATYSYDGYRVYGSSDWQTHTYIYWAKDDIETVKKYYERFFPEFTSQKEAPPAAYGASEVVLDNLDVA